MVKNVCVYCSSSSKIAPLYFDIADLLAKLLANNSMNLVYGGGDVGLMGKLARTVKENGGKVIGIIPKIFADKNIVFREADEMIITETMRERKRIMDEKSDAFIALPGGFGTLDELIEILSLKQLHCHNKAVVILDINGYYTHLIAQFEKSYEMMFAKEEYRGLYFVTDKLEEAIDYLKEYTPENIPTKWYQ